MVSLEKVEKDAPHLVSLVKAASVVLEKKGLDPSKFPAEVVATLDKSGSTEMGSNRLYSKGVIQDVLDIAFAAGLLFDDDGSVPVSVFDNSVRSLGDMKLKNAKGFLKGVHAGGGTSYLSALRWIVDEAGFGRVKLESGGKSGFFGKKTSGLQVLGTKKAPVYALFVTDGEPSDRTQDIEEYLTLMSQLPIFVQFVGVGSHKFEFLKRLDELDGRFIDNANFFDAKDANGSQDKILELMLAEFPDFYREARTLGLVTA